MMVFRYTSIIIAAFLVYLFANIRDINADGHKHQHDHHDHHNKTIELGKKSKLIGLRVNKIKDTMDGWNIQILASNFGFSPLNAGKKHISGQGHAHLYINGEKQARLYGSWFHLSSVWSETKFLPLQLSFFYRG
ncbi:MAG: hypothetical protein AB8G05_11010 [Oligoflexales bacterium]